MARFGGASSSTAAPSAPTPTAGFSFASSGINPGMTAPAPTFASPSAPAATSQPNLQQQSASMVVPDFDAIFPNIQILDRIERLLAKVSLDTDEGRWELQVLLSLLQGNAESSKCVGHILAHPKPLPWKAANPAVRNQLQSNPVVTFQRTPEKPASLTTAMLQEVWSLADDLRVSESEALTLYAQASKIETRNWLKEEELAGNLVVIMDKEHGQDEATVPYAARQLYFCECHSLLHTVLLLLQKRIQATEHLDTWGSNFLRATDTLLQGNLVHHLIALIRDLTQQHHDLEEVIKEAKNIASASVPSFSPGLEMTAVKPVSKPLFQNVLLGFVQRERQVAAECLFFLAYNSQFSVDEVAALIDLVKELTNQGLPGIDPFDDKIIPNPYQEAPVSHWQAPPWAPSPSVTPFTQPAKDPLAWQHELVRNICRTGQPQLLQCVSVLVLAGICALDAQHELMDRSLHGPNPFGVGNALLPPGTTDVSGLTLIHARLAPIAYKEWVHRKDILGLFSASYALLLRSVPTILSSPRGGPMTSPMQSTNTIADFKYVWRDCLEAPTEMKSFTFARLTLLPALRGWTRPQPVTSCRSDEFFFSVLAEWTSRYLEVLCASGDVPISRAQWEKEKEDELALLRSQQEQQRQFRAWSGSVRQEEGLMIANHVDLLTRPDCMDDVIALSVAVCSIHPGLSSSFWLVEERQEENEDASHKLRLVPSRSLRDLEGLLQQDRSLLPSYLSFLAALALVESPITEEAGAVAVHRILSRVPDSTNGAVVVNWRTIMDTLRWYARELSPQDYSLKSSSNTTNSTSSTATGGSTAYYYGAGNDRGSDMSGIQSQDGGTTGSNSTAKPKELGDTNILILSSHLAVISNVAHKLPEARSAVLGIKLPVDGSNEGGEDTALAILFSLSIIPLPPELRGAVFATIATLLQVDPRSNKEQTKQIRELARAGWDLLDDCQVLPIGFLDQYAPPLDGLQRLASNITFPPSSIALVGEGNNSAWTPNDPTYGVLFEMEHIESRMGWYPSTEGLLKLLCSLITSCGCPYDLGISKRVRWGCSPYIEYVTQFVILRATAGNSASRLPFRMAGDKSRLLARAFEVVEAVLARYVVPRQTKSSNEWLSDHRSLLIDATDKLGISIVAEKIVIPPALNDSEVFAYDFRNSNVRDITTTNLFAGNNNQTSTGVFNATRVGSSMPSIPLPKSPGFAVLADILSAQGGKIFRALAATLAEYSAKRGMGNGALDEIEARQFACAFGLLGELIPSISSAKTIAKGSMPSYPRQTLLKPIAPAIEGTFLDHIAVDDPAKWRERATIFALRIFCAVAVREEIFLQTVNSAPSSLNFAPVLQFQRRGVSSVALEISTVEPTLLKDVLLLDVGTTDTVRSVVELIDYSASIELHDAEICAPAIAFTFYLHKHLQLDESDKVLHSRNGRDLLTEAVAKRLIVSSKRPAIRADFEVLQLILTWIVAGLREPPGSGKTVAHRLLGLPTGVCDHTWLPSHKLSTLRPTDSLDAMIHVLRDIRFITGRRSSFLATTCFEILARLCEGADVAGLTDIQRIFIAAERLRNVDFWSFHLVVLLAEGANQDSVLSSLTARIPHEGIEGAENVLHSIAWLLKGVSNELRLLSGAAQILGNVDVVDQSMCYFLSPQPRKCEKLLSLLFSSPYELLKSVLTCIPVAASISAEVDDVLPPKEAVECATVSLPGPPDVVSGYKQVDYAKLLLRMKYLFDDGKDAALRHWVNQWNSRAALDCAASHLSDAVRIALGSSLLSSTWLNEEFCLLLSDNVNGTSAINPANLAEMLNLTLSRLIGDDTPGYSHYGMDDVVFSMASLSLSQVSLLLAERIVAEKGKGGLSLSSFTYSDFLHLYGNLAKAISLSSSSHGAFYSFSRREERTAILASALNTMLNSSHAMEVPNIRRDLVFQAGIALSHLSSFHINVGQLQERQGHPPPAAVAAARSCLASMIDFFSGEVDSIAREESFTFGILTKMNDSKRRNFGQLLVDLVSFLDERVAAVVVAFVRNPFGGDLLIDNGLMQALTFAAGSYAAKEAEALRQAGTQAGGYSSIVIATPTFLGEHLEVLKSLLSSPHISRSQRKIVAENVSKALSGHRSVIERLFFKFPVDNDVLVKCFECVALAEAATQSCMPVDPNQAVTIQKKPYIGYLELSIFDLTFHLLENPLPRQLLTRLPLAFTSSLSSETLHTVPALRRERSSWWETVMAFNFDEGRLLPDPLVGASNFLDSHPAVSWTEAKYECSIRGAELASLGLSLLLHKATHEKFPFTSDLSVARSLCRIADTARAIEGRVGILDQVLGASSAHTSHLESMDTDDSTTRIERNYLRNLGMKLGRCAEILLIIALSRLRAIKLSIETDDSERQLGNSKRELEMFSRAVATALDYNAIETMGVGCVIWNQGEGGREFAMKLAKALRNEIKIC